MMGVFDTYMKIDLTMEPIDANARDIIRDNPSERPMTNHTHRILKECPPLERWVSRSEKQKRKNLTGQKHGKLTVIGYYGKAKGSTKYNLWVVQCECGNYQIRRTEKVRCNNGPGRPSAPDRMCSECDYIERIKTRQRKQALGMK
jgi:hypothetical protein